MSKMDNFEKIDRIRSELQVADMLDTTEVIIPERIAKQVEEAARAVRVMRGLVKVNRDLVGQPGMTVKIPIRGTVTAAAVAEGIAISKSQQTYATVPITPTKVGVGIQITQEALESSMFDLINDWITEAGVAIAVKEDTDIVNDFLDVKGHASILTVNAGTKGTLAYDDIADARAKVLGEKFTPDSLVMNPAQSADLLKDTKFINASAYGSTSPLQNGEIGRIGGLTVYVSTQMTDGKALIFDSKRASYLVQKRDVTVKRRENPDTDSLEIYMTVMYKPFVVNEKAVCLILDC